MKLMVCISQEKYANEIVSTLNQHGFRSTKLASSGGFLKKGNSTFLIGITDEQKDNLFRIIEEACNREDNKKPIPTILDEGQIRGDALQGKEQNRVTIFVVNALNGNSRKTGS